MPLNSKIPLLLSDIYQDNNIQWKPTALIDGSTAESYVPSYQMLYSPHILTVDLLKYKPVTVRRVRIFEKNGGPNFSTELRLQKEDGTYIYFTPTHHDNSGVNEWKEYIPNSFEVSARFLMIGDSDACYGAELEIFADYEPYTPPTYNRPRQKAKKHNAVNSYIWDGMKNEQTPWVVDQIYDPKYNAIKALGINRIRIYMPKNLMNPGSKDVYFFNPTSPNAWYFDTFLTRLKADNIKGQMIWLGQPQEFIDEWAAAGKASQLHISYANNNNRETLAAWEDFGKYMFTVASRWGNNPNVPDYNVGAGNTMLKGMGVIDTLELAMNEPDSPFYGTTDEYMIGRQLAYAWSMGYDGNKGQFPNCGAKAADATLKIVNTGLAVATTDLVRGAIDVWRVIRGYKPNGDVDIPFDIISFHKYSYTGGLSQYAGGSNHSGLPPEASDILQCCEEFVDLSNNYCGGAEIIVGEYGNDSNQGSPMCAPAFGPYTVQQVRARWWLRTILGFMKVGIDASAHFKLFQTDYNSPGQFNSMNLLDHTDPDYPRLAIGNWWKQFFENYGEMVFEEVVNSSGPMVYKFKDGTKERYFIWGVETVTYNQDAKPTFTENTGTYNLALPDNPQIRYKTFNDNTATMNESTHQVSGGQYPVNYSATPVVVEVQGAGTPGGAGDGEPNGLMMIM